MANKPGKPLVGVDCLADLVSLGVCGGEYLRFLNLRGEMADRFEEVSSLAYARNRTKVYKPYFYLYPSSHTTHPGY
jgi:hypothetical protein